MRWFGINISGDDVGLDFVAVNAGAAARVIDRVQEREKFAGLVAVAECGEGKDGPDRRMSILAAVFADAGQVPFDVARIRARAVEWRGEQERRGPRRDERDVSRPLPWRALPRAGSARTGNDPQD